MLSDVIATLTGMPCTPEPAAVITQMLELLAEHDLPAPDVVERGPGEVVLVWYDRRLSVVVELDAPR